MCLRHEGFPACTTPTLRGRAPCGDVSVKRRNPGEHRTISQDSRVACSFWCYSNFSSSRNQNITSVVFIHLANHSNPHESLAQTSLNFVLSPSDVAGVDIMFKTSLVGLSRTELRFLLRQCSPLYRSQHVRKEPVSSKHTHTHTIQTPGLRLRSMQTRQKSIAIAGRASRARVCRSSCWWHVAAESKKALRNLPY